MLNGISLGIIIVIVLLIASFILSLLINLLLVPIIKTPKEVIDEILQLMDLKKEDTIVDLGSGDGRLLLKAHEQSRCRCIGYDISPIMLIIANTKRIVKFPFTKDIIFEPKDVFQVDLSGVSKIYCYLDQKSMDILKRKLEKFVEDGGEVYSYGYGIKDIKNEKRVVLKNKKELYIYKRR
ncbi:MAG: methyltransferase domain-containing protein [Candidatus Dojkabacteria bacterium]|nr:methyltransferase domain-containing protein [Candidatus Dojkabacteria bacterium]